jgi:uncharacterized protein
VQSVIDYLGTFQAEAFAEANSRTIKLPFLPEGKGVSGENYVVEMGLPNFMFHLTMVYAILRSAGVDLGKRDFIGGMTLIDA